MANQGGIARLARVATGIVSALAPSCAAMSSQPRGLVLLHSDHYT